MNVVILLIGAIACALLSDAVGSITASFFLCMIGPGFLVMAAVEADHIRRGSSGRVD